MKKFFTSKHWAARLARIFLAAAVLITVALMMFENHFIYFPSSEAVGRPDVPFEDVFFTASDGVKLHGWFVPVESARGTLLYCHGNAGNITHRIDMVRNLNRQGVSVFIFDYRGYGRSEASPSEEGLYRDARAAYDYLTLVRTTPPERVVLFGESLGGAPAIRLASEVPCGALISQSAFTSVPDMAGKMFWFLPWVRLFVRARFSNLETIPKVQAPKLVVHGPADEIVPFWMGRKLFDAAPEPKDFFEVPGVGHNESQYATGYFERLGAFLSRVLPR